MYWTLVVFAAFAVDTTVVDGFHSLAECQYLGRLNLEHVNPNAEFRCEKTNIPPVKCERDRRYNSTANCLIYA